MIEKFITYIIMSKNFESDNCMIKIFKCDDDLADIALYTLETKQTFELFTIQAFFDILVQATFNSIVLGYLTGGITLKNLLQANLEHNLGGFVYESAIILNAPLSTCLILILLQLAHNMLYNENIWINFYILYAAYLLSSIVCAIGSVAGLLIGISISGYMVNVLIRTTFISFYNQVHFGDVLRMTLHLCILSFSFALYHFIISTKRYEKPQFINNLFYFVSLNCVIQSSLNMLLSCLIY